MNAQFSFLKTDSEQQTINKTTLTKHRKWSPEHSGSFNRTYSQLLALPRQMRRRLQRQFGLSLVGLALTLALSGTPIAKRVQAKPANVPTAGITVDGTTCTLEEAITSANNDNAAGNGCDNGSGADIITLAADVTLTAVNNTSANGPNGLPVITSEITIEGADFTIARDGSAPDFRLFEVAASGDLTLNNTTVSGGFLGTSVSSQFRKGSGLFTDGGTLTLNDSTVSNNDTGSGAGIELRNPAATLTLNNSIVSGNGNQNTRGGGIRMVSGASGLVNHSYLYNNQSRYGGGLYIEGGSLEITNSTIKGNTASNYGGGMYIDNTSTVITITNSTITNNTANKHGGGIADDEGASVTITNSTISGNNAPEGGGVHLYSGANDDSKMSIINSTIISNTATTGKGGGIYNNSYMTLNRSLISGNTAGSGGDEIYNKTGKIITADAYNLLADNSKSNAAAFTNFTLGASDITATSDGTTPTALTSILNTTLADNGGQTLTHALVSGSPAIDQAGSCGLATDQRGATRAGGAGSGGNSCDIGAYEYDSLPLAVTLASLQAIATGEHVVVRWETVSELENFGFNLYRATELSGAQEQLNRLLISAQAPGSGQGSAYEFVDEEVEAGESYYYWLEDVEINGQTSLHGPVSATLNLPTAITLEGFTIDVPTFSLWGLMGFMLALLTGGWVWRRQ